ncbi:MAG: hypothetical protein H6867_06865 [Rhodospirillales bacterium]|nr:hypothetical protein [Rhodospirillales bacterium]MCB9995271.1 hypothetical protein [Rhodospirillales bacterium]
MPPQDWKTKSWERLKSAGNTAIDSLAGARTSEGRADLANNFKTAIQSDSAKKAYKVGGAIAGGWTALSLLFASVASVFEGEPATYKDAVDMVAGTHFYTFRTLTPDTTCGYIKPFQVYKATYIADTETAFSRTFKTMMPFVSPEEPVAYDLGNWPAMGYTECAALNENEVTVFTTAFQANSYMAKEREMFVSSAKSTAFDAYYNGTPILNNGSIRTNLTYGTPPTIK